MNGYYRASRREAGLRMSTVSATPGLGFHDNNNPSGKAGQAYAASRLSVRISDVYTKI